MDSLNNRIKTYSHISTELPYLSSQQFSDLLDKAIPMHSGINGKSFVLTISGVQIFVKKIPLTDIERLPENLMSTCNFFNLPLCYQYGIGSAGFGAWRELLAHVMTTDWVISGECANFPILYHWRLLPTSRPTPMNTEQLEKLERDVQYWENSPAIRKRLEAIHDASAHILLFLEYIPQTLQQWLETQLAIGGNTAEMAISFVDQKLKETNDFMNRRGLMHFDAHFRNILTDGKLLYFTDFGLALSSRFELSNAEIEFLNTHHTYDQYSTVTNLLYCVVTSLFGRDEWELRLRECLDGKHKKLTPFITSLIKQYGPITLMMDAFYEKLQKENKTTPYPG